MSLADYADPPEVESGVKAYLTDASGKPTEDWLLIRSFRSAEFQRAILRSSAILSDGGSDDPEKLRDALIERRSALVAGWSDSEPCTPEAVKALLRKSSRIGQWIDAFAAEDAHFFGRALNGLSRGQKPNSG